MLDCTQLELPDYTFESKEYKRNIIYVVKLSSQNILGDKNSTFNILATVGIKSSVVEKVKTFRDAKNPRALYTYGDPVSQLRLLGSMQQIVPARAAFDVELGVEVEVKTYHFVCILKPVGSFLQPIFILMTAQQLDFIVKKHRSKPIDIIPESMVYHNNVWSFVSRYVYLYYHPLLTI